MKINDLIDAYAGGPRALRAAVSGLSAAQIDAAPVPGKWSTRQVICHIADFEPVYTDRMKRVVAEESPPLRGGDPDVFAAKLAYDARDIEEELQLIEVVRKQMVRLLRTFDESAFDRVGVHSVDGPLSLRTLLERITRHIPHHIAFIEEKRKLLGA